VTVRLAYVLLVQPEVPFVGDGRTYHLLGRNIADGRGYLAPYDWFFQGRSRPTAEFGPVHPSLLAVASFFGASTITAQQVFLALVGSATSVLTALLALRVTGRQRVAVLAGLLAAVHPLLFGSDGALMSETTYTLLGLLLALALLDRRLVVAAVVLGVAVLTRGDAVLLVPFLVVPLLWRAWRQIAVVVGIAVLAVAPWVVRNAVRFDGQLVLSNNLGSLVNGSNCPATYAGPKLGSWDFDCAYELDGLGQDEAANSVRLRDAGLRYARDHVGRVPVVVAARVARGWGVLHPFGQARAERHDGRVVWTQTTGVVLDWVLLPLAVVGLVALGRRGIPLLGPLAMVTVVVAVAYGNSRLREVAEPALVIAATYGLTTLTERR
jgi:hypothetical protein